MTTLFQYSPIYQTIKQQIETDFNQRLNNDYKHLIDQLATKIPPEVLQQLPPLSPVSLNLVSKSAIRPKITVPLHNRCQALNNSGNRCIYSVAADQEKAGTADQEKAVDQEETEAETDEIEIEPPDEVEQKETSHYCQKHQKNPPQFSLKSIYQAFQPMRSDPVLREALDLRSDQPPKSYQMLSLTTQRGRKYYQVPSDNLIQEYVAVRPIDIAGQFYLQDQQGLIYGYSETVPILGRQIDNLIVWYQKTF